MGSIDTFRISNGTVGMATNVDTIPVVSLPDSSTINWDASTASNAVVKLNHNLTSRIFSKPHNLVSGQTYTLTLIQDTVGGAAVIFDSSITIASSINTQPMYKTIITFKASGSGTSATLNSLVVAYQLDKTQTI